MKHNEFLAIVGKQENGGNDNVKVTFHKSLTGLTLATGDSQTRPAEGEGDFILMGATEIESQTQAFNEFIIPRFLSVDDGKVYSFGIDRTELTDAEIGDTFVLDVEYFVSAKGRNLCRGKVIEQFPTEWEVEPQVNQQRQRRERKTN